MENLYLQITGGSSQIVDNTNYAIILLTIVLVGATIFYSIQTFRTVSVLRATREEEFLPTIVPALSMMGPVFIVLEIFNIGKGGAINLEVKYTIEEFNQDPKVWYQYLFKSGDSQVFYLKDQTDQLISDLKFFEEKQVTLRIEASYFDIFGNSHTKNHTIDASRFVKQFTSVSAQYKEEDKDRKYRATKQIADSLRDFHRDMRDLNDYIYAQWNANRIDFQIEVTINQINNLRLSSKNKEKIILLINQLAVFLRERHFSLHDKEIIEIINKIEKISPLAFKIIKDTMVILRYVVRFDEEKKNGNKKST